MPAKSTLTQYAKITKSLIMKASRRYKSKKVSPDQVVGSFLLSRNSTPSEYSMRTYRLYKSALALWMQSNNHTHLMSFNKLMESTSAGLLKRSRKTSGLKMKHISNLDHVVLCDYLANHRHRWQLAGPLGQLLLSGYITGLRPEEWRHATLTERQLTAPANATHTLVVQNAKATYGRANGVSRDLHLRLSLEDASAIAGTIENFAGLTDLNYARFYKRLRDLMHRSVRLLWPKRKRYPSIYTHRHQFKANAVAGGATPAEVAAMMGHASDRTAPRNYGRKGGDKNLLRASPDALSLAAVRNKSLTQQLGLLNEPGAQAEPEPLTKQPNKNLTPI